jgi:hypothetical protein
MHCIYIALYKTLITICMYVCMLQREIGNIVSSMMVGKELEECVRNMYKKFVKGKYMYVCMMYVHVQ